MAVQSVRTLSWLDVDRARTDFAMQVFERNFSYAHYAAWAMAVPALGLLRGGRVVDTLDRSFADCLTHSNDGIAVFPVDWQDHLRTLWPAVRWDDGIELRVADTGTVAHAMALLALWKGLLGHAANRHEVQRKLVPQSFGRSLQKSARSGLSAQTEHGSALVVCKELVRLAGRGLPPEERRYLEPAERALSLGLSPADELRLRFGREWKSSHQLLLATRPQA